MGAGKSTVGLRLAHRLGWPFIDLDEEIVRAEQKSIAEIFESAGEAGFRKLEQQAVAARIEQDDVVIALGGGAVETAANLVSLASDAGTFLLYLEAPLDVLIARCEQQYRTDAAAARRPVLEQRAELSERFSRRKRLYESAHWTLPTAGRVTEEIVDIVLTRWKEPIASAAESTHRPGRSISG